MRILLISNIFPPKVIGGYELRACDFARRLCRDGHHVAVASSPIFASRVEEGEPFEVFRTLECVDFSPQVRSPEDRLHLGLFANLDNVAALATLIGTVNPDAVFCFNLNGLGAFGLLHLLHALGHQPVWFIGDTLTAAKNQNAEIARFAAVFGSRAIFEKTIFVAEASASLQELARDVGMPVPVASWFPGVLMGPDLDAGCCASPGVLRLVFASRIEVHKGIEVLLDAAARVRDRGAVEFRIDVFGAGRIAQFQQEVHARHLESIVHYRGMLPKPEMLSRLGDYDALLLPTWEREPFGGVAVEAAAVGCIPVLTAGIGAAEWMVDGLDCIKISRDPEHLAAAIIDLARMEPAERTAFRQRVKRNARLTFDFERWFGKVTDLLEAAAANRCKSRDPPARILMSLALLTHIWRS